METAGIRRRKPGQELQDVHENVPLKPSDSSDPGFDLTPVWAVFCFAVALLMWLYPHAVEQYVRQLISPGPDQQLPGINTILVYSGADYEKRDAIVEAFKSAWAAYERDAMGDDEYHPISHSGSNLSAAGGIGYTVVDAIDTMLIMGLKPEYKRARDWVANDLTFDKDGNYSTFETTIRVLGGLLSAYHLSDHDTMYLDRAVDLADRILPAFETASGLPLPFINLGRKEGVPDPLHPEWVATAEVATLQLELRHLTFLTDDDVYWRAAEKVMQVIKGARMPPGLASITMNHTAGKFMSAPVRLGSRGDSYYEYLLKQYIQTNQTERVYRDMYEDAMTAVHNYMIYKSPIHNMTHTVELRPRRNTWGQIGWRSIPKQDHLACFLGGSLMLGAVATAPGPVSVPPRAGELGSSGVRDWTTGVGLIETCMRTHETKTGLPPEIVHFTIMNDLVIGREGVDRTRDWHIKDTESADDSSPYDARYMLRPETIESLFIAFRVTGNQSYRDYGWKIFEAIQKHCRPESGGYASILDVQEIPVRHVDKSETFLLSETFKYLYLLFDDVGTLPFSQYVYNTEAHPLPIFNPTVRTGFT